MFQLMHLKEFDFVKPTYLVDWNNRSCEIIKDRMETRLREVKRAIEQIYDRYLSFKNRYINGETIDIEESILNPLWAEIREKYGFRVNMKHLAFFGLCPKCQK